MSQGDLIFGDLILWSNFSDFDAGLHNLNPAKSRMQSCWCSKQLYVAQTSDEAKEERRLIVFVWRNDGGDGVCMCEFERLKTKKKIK